jgi:hypothetical protein
MPEEENVSTNKLKAIGGLIAVVVGIGAVTGLAIVTITRFGSGETESTVAITSSAFGIISAVVGAYLGIKITADTTARAGENVKKAAVAEHEAHITREQVSAMEEKAVETAPALAGEIKAAGLEAREEAAEPGRPPGGVA